LTDMKKSTIGRNNSNKVSEDLRLAFVHKHFDSFKSLADQGWHVSEKIIPLIHSLASDAREMFGYSEKSNPKVIVNRFLRLYKKHFVADAVLPIKKVLELNEHKRELHTIWKPCQYCKGTGKAEQSLNPSTSKFPHIKLINCGYCGGDGISSDVLGFFQGGEIQKIAAEKPVTDSDKYHSSKEVEKVGVEIAVQNQLRFTRSGHLSNMKNIGETTSNIKDALLILAREIDLIKQRL